MPEEIAVRHVTGRYPHGGAMLRSENMVASVSEIGRVYRVRIEDSEHPDAWMDVTIEVGGDEVILAEPLDAEDLALLGQKELPP